MFKIYKSSAGSGKTYTLVKEYLKIALSGEENYRHILAITFTNKAASEMKGRIMSALRDFSNPGGVTGLSKALLEDLSKEFKSDESQIKTASEVLLNNILHNYSDFAVSTIDSFVHRIVRTFVHDLQLPWNFEVEVDDDQLLSRAVDSLISRVGNDDNLTAALVEFSEARADEGKNWNIERDLKGLTKTLLQEESIPYIEKLKGITVNEFIDWARRISALKKKFNDSIETAAKEALQLIDSNGLNAKDFSLGIYNFLHRLSGEVNIDNLDFGANVSNAVEKNMWYPKSNKNFKKQKVIAEIAPKLQGLLKRIDETKRKHLNDYILCDLLSKNIYSMALLNEIERVFEELKIEKKVLHISEFNKRVNRIVSTESVPFIYERLGEKYKNFLIDEFQDTSVLQWHNFLPLIENALAEGHFNMIVGDGKQAIYRFRGGDVNQFNLLPKVQNSEQNAILKEREDALIREHRFENLRMNYRSKEAIVRFTNDLFTYLAGMDDFSYKNIYAGHRQETSPGQKGGYVSVEFSPYEQSKVRSPNDHYQSVIALITDCVRSGYDLKDVALLFRNNDEASAAARFLINNRIDVISSESLLIGKSIDVQFMLAVFRYVRDPQDQIAKAEILYFLFNATSVKSSSLNQFFHSAVKNMNFQKILNDLGFDFNPALVRVYALYETAEKIIQTFRLTEKPNIFIQHFLDMVLEYSGTHNNSMDDFLAWWDDNESRFYITIPEGVNAVTISTIHKAKGLEFPVVILPHADWRIEKTKDSIWVELDKDYSPPCVFMPVQKALAETELKTIYEEEKQKTFLDNLNFLYVALTRAKDRLYLFSQLTKSEPDPRSSIAGLLVHHLKGGRIWPDINMSYEFGTKARKSETKSDVSRKYELENFYSTTWRSKIIIKFHSEKTDWGNLVHDVLARIKSPKDDRQALDDMVLEGVLSEDSRSKLEAHIRRLLERKDVLPFFEEDLDVKTEAEIILPDHSLIRLDRIVFKKDLTTILDFKTGSEEPDHHLQLKKYRTAVADLGYPNVEAYLIYTDEEKSVKVGA